MSSSEVTLTLTLDIKENRKTDDIINVILSNLHSNLQLTVCFSFDK